MTAWQGGIVNRAPDELDELRWSTRDALSGLALAHARLPDRLDHASSAATP